MPDASAAVSTAERSVAQQPVKAAEVKPVRSQGDSEAVRQFGQMAEKALSGGSSSNEALIGIAGWRLSGRVESSISNISRQIVLDVKEKRVSEGKAAEYLQRLGDVGKMAEEKVLPALEKLDNEVTEEAKTGKVSPFMRDLNYHYIQSDIKALEGNDTPQAKEQLQELQKDLIAAEKAREGLTPEQDEVTKVALSLSGLKTLPKEFADRPLDYIDSFFARNLRVLTKNQGALRQVAQRMNVSPEELKDLISVYEQGKEVETQLLAVDDELNGREPAESDGKKLKKGVSTISTIMAALMAIQMHKAFKREEPGGGQAMG